MAEHNPVHPRGGFMGSRQCHNVIRVTEKDILFNGVAENNSPNILEFCLDYVGGCSDVHLYRYIRPVNTTGGVQAHN